jgi:hypothetical protein
MNRVCILVLAALLAVPAAANAAPPWIEPLTVPGSEQANPFSVGLSLGSGERGTLGFAINPQPLLVDSPQSAAVSGVGRGAPGNPRSLAPYDLAAPPVAYANIRSILALQRTLDRDRAVKRVAVSLASLPGAVGAPRVLDASVKLRDVAVAANADGAAAIVWTEDRGFSGRRANNDRLYLSLRPVGGRFGRPSILVGSGKLSSVSVAYGSNGQLLVAFERQAIGSDGSPGPRRVQARYRTRGGGFGVIDDLGAERGVTQIVTAVAANGRAYVAWGTQDAGIEANEPFEVRAATRASRGTRFRDAVALDRGRGRSVDRPRGRLSIAIDRSGADAVLGFDGLADGGAAFGTLHPVLVSSTGRRGNFGLPERVPGANGAVGGIVVNPGGEATVVWTQLTLPFGEQATGVLSSTRTVGGSFPLVTEVVSAVAPSPYSLASVALPAAGGLVQTAWYEGPATGIKVSRRAP